MNVMRRYEIEELGRLLALLPPEPAGWAEAASALPQLRAGLDDLIARAEQDAALRERLLADLESALAESGIRPTRVLLDEARRRLAR